MRIYKYKRLKEAPQIVDQLLQSVGAADPTIDIKITAALSKNLERKGRTGFDPEIGATLPVEGVDVEARLKAELLREFAKAGTGLILVEIERAARPSSEGHN